MPNLVRCKACGFIIDQKKVKDVCPACGVSSKAFEPFQDTLSAKRRYILDLHGHPILVHFPQALAVLIFSFLTAGWLLIKFNKDNAFISQNIQVSFISASYILIYLLPISVIAAFITGIIDGKIRFKTVLTQLLIKKFFLGSILFILSVAGAVIVFKIGSITTGIIPWLILFSLICVICEILLGNIGSSIMESKLPG